MFEVTGDDIASLSDADLRTLIGLLCEADVRRLGLPASSVTYGGNQDAKDGGIDVRVALPDKTVIHGFIPAAATGFQVKKPDMRRADILKEMRPQGNLRPVIQQLADIGGSYIIVSSTGATSDSALKDRRSAMAEAIKGTPAEGRLTLDFYDRSRIATWVRERPGQMLWVRARCGRAMPGWRPYGPWSLAPGAGDSSYIFDGQACIRAGENPRGAGVPTLEGINRIRNVLATPGRVVRLVGLSGVGKTRLAEALFDDGVGESSLDPSLAVYTNEADEPSPSPVGLASDLIALRTRAIIVVDNCNPELHRRISEIARSLGSTISVITIEYDIREDQPDGTDVFVLETSSVSLIEKLVARRNPHLSQIDAHTIAEFSGGNARVALSLASQVKKTETVAGLNDEDLFIRLFQQRHDSDPSLLIVAQACSLVYSFDGETLNNPESELAVLGSVVGKKTDEMYAGVAELKQRDLVQERAVWRAVLPHAIANRLAKRALRTIAPGKLKSVLIDDAPERILRSFSRRLGYLDDSKEARVIVSAWLAHDGLLGDPSTLDELGRAIFANVAPVAPESVLAALEAVLSKADEAKLLGCTHFVPLLRSLAFDPVFFKRALALLVKFAALPSGNPNNSEAAGVVESLFHMVLSGTHAPLATRLKAVEALIASEAETERRIGIKGLEALMKTSHFSSSYGFEFGARSRDFGYTPATEADVRAWFDNVLKLATKLALSATPVAEEVQNVIARNFRGLWREISKVEELAQLARAISATSFWRAGWIAARQTRTYDAEDLSRERRDALTTLEEDLRPQDLLSKVRALVSGPGAGSLDLYSFDGDENDDQLEPTLQYANRAARSAAAIRQLGQDIAADVEAFRTVLPEFRAANAPAAATFGEAVASATKCPRQIWDLMRAQIGQLENADLRLMAGFLAGLKQRDGELADSLLDEALDDPVLANRFPTLQASVDLDERAMGRLHRAIELRKAPITTYYGLAYGSACDNVPGPEFLRLVRAIIGVPSGSLVAIQMIAMRLHSDFGAKRQPLPEIREAGRLLLASFEFSPKDNHTPIEDHQLGTIVVASLAGEEGVPVVKALCGKLRAAVNSYRSSCYDYGDLMKALLSVQPRAVLDVLFGEDLDSQQAGVRLFRELLHFHRNFQEPLPDHIVIDWCDLNPRIRYPLAASFVLLFQRPKQDEAHVWTPLATKLLEGAPEPRLVLNEIVYRLRPSSWSGSLATKLEERLKLLNRLPGSEAPALAESLVTAKTSLHWQIQKERRAEQEEDRAQSNRFE